MARDPTRYRKDVKYVKAALPSRTVSRCLALLSAFVLLPCVGSAGALSASGPISATLAEPGLSPRPMLPDGANDATTTTAPTTTSTPEPSPAPLMTPTPESTPTPEPTPTPSPTPPPLQKVVVENDLHLYVMQGHVLVAKVTVPAGSVLAVPVDYALSNADYIDESGQTVRSSTGFIYPVQILSLPGNTAGTTDSTSAAAAVAALNQSTEVLYVSGTIIDALQGVDGNFAPLAAATPGEGYLAHYEADGRPKFVYLKSLTQRFGTRLNRPVDLDKSPRAAKNPAGLAREKIKWRKVFAEIERIADRSVESPKSTLLMSRTAARRWSESFDATGAVASNGIWSIAIQTSERHGFADTPCAEFISEVLRQAYRRAGYNATIDFNAGKDAELTWQNTSSVARLSRSLANAGWVPWTTDSFRPPLGAILFTTTGGTPGHAYLSAGDGGRFFIDNGSPQGRDLRMVSEARIDLMYKTGLFFLPPGVNPEALEPRPLPSASPTPTATPLPVAAPTPPPRVSARPAPPSRAPPPLPPRRPARP